MIHTAPRKEWRVQAKREARQTCGNSENGQMGPIALHDRRKKNRLHQAVRQSIQKKERWLAVDGSHFDEGRASESKCVCVLNVGPMPIISKPRPQKDARRSIELFRILVL